ncbi:MAG: LCP family protein [Acidimicrobiia bacterium]|nr:LCP family protein [Acidimicrobiia bacterium]
MIGADEIESAAPPLPGRNRAGRPRPAATAPPATHAAATRAAARPGAASVTRHLRRRPRPVGGVDVRLILPRTWLTLALVALLLVPTLALIFGWYQFRQIDRVEVGDALSSDGAGTDYLVVGSDTREGIDDDDPRAGAFLGSTVSGERTDTIMVLRTEGDRSYLLSVPRDLWVTDAATGEQGRINAVYRSGPQALIRTVQQSVGIPIHHYLEIDFVSFAGLVDAVGGITIDFPHPARDERSGLFVPEAGPRTLDGGEALAYVRSHAHTRS